MMPQVVHKVSKPGKNGPRSVHGNESDGRSVLVLLKSKHCSFMGCNRDRYCFQKMRPSLQEKVEGGELNEESDIVQSEEVDNEARTYLGSTAKGTDVRVTDVCRFD